jgi:hypothetical protein
MPELYINSERDFYQEALNTNKKKLLSGSIVNEFQKVGEIQYSSNMNIDSPRKIYPEKFIDDVNSRYLI